MGHECYVSRGKKDCQRRGGIDNDDITFCIVVLSFRMILTEKHVPH